MSFHLSSNYSFSRKIALERLISVGGLSQLSGQLILMYCSGSRRHTLLMLIIALGRLCYFRLEGLDFVGGISVDELNGRYVAAAHYVVPDAVVNIAF